MNQKRRTIGKALSAAACAAAGWMVLTGALPAAAQAEVIDSVCVQGCVDSEKSCSDPVREEAVACRAAAGCEDLLDAATVACTADRTGEECLAARAAVRECFAPCREAERAGLDACRATALTCLRDECGLDGLPPRCNTRRPRPGFGA